MERTLRLGLCSRHDCWVGRRAGSEESAEERNDGQLLKEILEVSCVNVRF